MCLLIDVAPHSGAAALSFKMMNVVRRPLLRRSVEKLFIYPFLYSMN